MITKSNFKPAWWLTNRHLQTILPRVYPVSCDFYPFHHDFELSDGDFVEVTWSKNPANYPNDKSPIVVVLHGLEGSFESFYAKRMMNTIYNQSWTSVLMHFRDCGNKRNRKLQSYHSGQTSDLTEFIDHLADTYPKRDIYAIGFSLGGNVLAKYLGERPESKLSGAVVISAPMELEECANTVDQGFSKVYQKYLVDKLKKSAQEKFDMLAQRDKNVQYSVDPESISNVTKLKEFDELLTAPINGFASAHDYYKQSSCKPFLAKISTPTLILHAMDDPFMNEKVIPTEQEISSSVTVELSEKGGHVGFLSGRNPFKPEFWLETRSVTFFNSLITNQKADK
ncbi:MAG: hydrolase [Gammaproteobacteria bacterium]|nr:hydrolase [Gammaproteobacteria bacterium]